MKYNITVYEETLCHYLTPEEFSNLSLADHDWTSEHSMSFTRAIIITMVVIAICGFILNLAQIIWISLQRRKSVIDVFIVSLALVDLQTCCFSIPLEILEVLKHHDWSIFGSKAAVVCRFYWFFRHGSAVAGSIIICLIAVSRYIAVSHPMRKAKEKCSQMCINLVLACLTWIITIAFVAPIVFSTFSITKIYTISEIGDQSNRSSNTTPCYKMMLGCVQENRGVGITIYTSVLFFVAPLVIMCVSYASLIRILIKRNHNLILAYKGNAKHFRKSIVNSILGLAYILLVTPKGIYDIVQLPRASINKHQSSKEMEDDLILYVIASFIVISNPVIYSFLTPRFFKFVEVHSHRAYWFHPSHHRQWTDINWSTKPKSLFLQKYFSHEEFLENGKSNRTISNHHHSNMIKVKMKPIRRKTEETLIDSCEGKLERIKNTAHVNRSLLAENPSETHNCISTDSKSKLLEQEAKSYATL